MYSIHCLFIVDYQFHGKRLFYYIYMNLITKIYLTLPRLNATILLSSLYQTKQIPFTVGPRGGFVISIAASLYFTLYTHTQIPRTIDPFHYTFCSARYDWFCPFFFVAVTPPLQHKTANWQMLCQQTTSLFHLRWTKTNSARVSEANFVLRSWGTH